MINKELEEITIYYSVKGACRKEKLFSFKFPQSPKSDAIRGGFEREHHRLSDQAKIFEIEENKKLVVDGDKLYLLKPVEDEDHKYEVFTYKGIKLTHDVELDFRFQAKNKTDRSLNNIYLKGDLVDFKNKKLNDIECDLALDPEFYESESFLDSYYLFSLDSSEHGKYIEEGEIYEELIEIFEDRGYSVEEDSKIHRDSGLIWIEGKEGKEYLIKNDGSDIKVYEALDKEKLKQLLPNDQVSFSVSTNLTLNTLIENYEGLLLNLKLIEEGNIKEKRFFDLSSSESFREKLKEELEDLKESLDREVSESEKSEHEGRPGCFIATAVYGDPESEKIDNLRDFRDDILLKKKSGRLFTDIYYKISPSLAQIISKNEYLRKSVGHMIVYPLSDLVEDFLDSE